MPLELITIPCLEDNYAFLIHNEATNEAAVVDVPDAAPINAAVAANGMALSTVLLTHHHDDHIAGVARLNADQLDIIGARADSHRIPGLITEVSEMDEFNVCGERTQVIDVPGHTVGHIAYYMPDAGLVFTGDSLMALGCGRLFEGTPDQMWDSLQKLRALPGDTIVCSGHEYTQSNARFAASLEDGNERLNSRIETIHATRAAGKPTVPSLLEDECATNPFLRADDPALKAAIGMPNESAAAVFAEVRRRKDNF